MSSPGKPLRWYRVPEVRNRLAAGVACLAVLGAAFGLAPVIERGPTVCPTRLLLGVPCPTCGITRAVCAAARGEFRQSFSIHLFGPLVAMGLVVLGPALIAEAFVPRRFRLTSRVFCSYALGYILLIALVVYYVVRLVICGLSGVSSQTMCRSAVGAAVRELTQWFG